METKDIDIVIAALEFAKEKSLVGERISYEEIFNHLVEQNAIGKDRKEGEFIHSIWFKICAPGSNTNQKGFISLDAYMGLLDYEELQQARADSAEARREAKDAMKYSKWAILVAIALGLIQIVVGVIQIAYAKCYG